MSKGLLYFLLCLSIFHLQFCALFFRTPCPMDSPLIIWELHFILSQLSAFHYSQPIPLFLSSKPGHWAYCFSCCSMTASREFHRNFWGLLHWLEGPAYSVNFGSKCPWHVRVQLESISSDNKHGPSNCVELIRVDIGGHPLWRLNLGLLIKPNLSFNLITKKRKIACL